MSSAVLATTGSFQPGKALRAIADVLIGQEAEPVSVTVGLDTMSDVTFASPSLLTNLRPTHTNVRGVGAASAFEAEGTLRVMVDGECIEMPALAASKEQLPHACLALLGMPAIGALNVSLDAQRVEQNQPLICYLGEKKLREWWDHNSDKSIDTKPFDRSKIQICPNLPAAVIQRVK